MGSAAGTADRGEPREQAAAAGEQSADGVSSAESPAVAHDERRRTLVGRTRDALREALTRYGDAPAAERVRQLLESLGEAPDIEATDAGPPRQPEPADRDPLRVDGPA